MLVTQYNQTIYFIYLLYFPFCLTIASGRTTVRPYILRNIRAEVCGVLSETLAWLRLSTSVGTYRGASFMRETHICRLAVLCFSRLFVGYSSMLYRRVLSGVSHRFRTHHGTSLHLRNIRAEVCGVLFETWAWLRLSTSVGTYRGASFMRETHICRLAVLCFGRFVCRILQHAVPWCVLHA